MNDINIEVMEKGAPRFQILFQYRSPIIPRVGERLWFNSKFYKVLNVQHVVDTKDYRERQILHGIELQVEDITDNLKEPQRTSKKVNNDARR
jgi:hypothetical protein